MCGEHHNGVVRNLSDRFDERHAAATKSVHHMTIMHDLMEDKDLLVVVADIEQLIDHIDSHIDAGTEAARICEKDLHEAAMIRPRRHPRRWYLSPFDGSAQPRP